MHTILKSYQRTKYINNFNHLNTLTSLNKRIELVFKPFSNLLYFSSKILVPDKKNFDKIITDRKCEAVKSIIVQVNSEKSAQDLYLYCKDFGRVKGMHYYALSTNHYFLIEFFHQNHVSNILENSSYYDDNIMAVKSQYFWFRANKGSRRKKMDYVNIPLIDNKTSINFDLKKINNFFITKNSISNQINSIYDACKMSDLSLRLRFITARQIEQALCGLFPSVNLLPFGSSINGFGNGTCDLDLYISLQNNIQTNSESQNRLIFQNRNSSANERAQVQKLIEILGDILSHFLPGCNHVRRISHARVPIIKYKQGYTGIECDLSLTSSLSIYMSEILYTLKEIDNRVAPLVFIVRCWAKVVGLTNSNPGRWITNFSLTLLVIFFLQNKAVLPPLQVLMDLSGPEDRKYYNNDPHPIFSQNISKILQSFTPNKNLDLEDLLKEFFNFYSSFQFEEKAISLKSGKHIGKPAECPMYIVNPLEENLNVSHNVSLEEIERIRTEMREAAWTFESEIPELSAIFRTEKQSKKKNNYSLHLDMAELFESENSGDKSRIEGNKVL